MKLIDRIKSDPRVECVDDEGEDGWWIHLKAGWHDSLSDPHCPLHAIHEWNLREAYYILQHGVTKCNCK